MILDDNPQSMGVTVRHGATARTMLDQFVNWSGVFRRLVAGRSNAAPFPVAVWLA